MPIARVVLIACACATLSACATPPASRSQPATPAVAAAPPAPLDGAYWGTSTRFRADRRNCPHPGLVKFDVQDGRFEYRWSWGTPVESYVLPNGEVHGQGEGITLVGRHIGPRIEGDVTNGHCGLHFTVKRRAVQADHTAPAGQPRAEASRGAG